MSRLPKRVPVVPPRFVGNETVPPGAWKLLKRGFSDDDMDLARREGWRIGLSTGEPKIMRVHRPPKRDGRLRGPPIFASDEAARVYFDGKVERDDPLAVKALTAMMRWRMER